MTENMNPKDAIGSNKLPLHLWPPSATAVGCLGLLDGMLKYGRSNFRATPVLASVYVGALKRHTDGYYEGETIDPDSKIPHLSGILANAAILVDAGAAGTLVDDRQYPGGYSELVRELTPHVARLKAKHAGKNPRHYTIADAVSAEAVAAPATVNVVVAVISREHRRHMEVFLQRRAFDDENFPGYWESPGGGVEPGESDSDALSRELKEELGITMIGFGPLIWRGQIAGYQARNFDFRFYGVRVDGRPRALDGQPDSGWFRLGDVSGGKMSLTPANLLAWPSIEAAVRVSGAKKRRVSK